MQRTISRETFRRRNELRLEDVPLVLSFDKDGADVVRTVVYLYAKTGRLDPIADSMGMQKGAVLRLLQRAAARETIAYMKEEGIWPEHEPTARETLELT